MSRTRIKDSLTEQNYRVVVAKHMRLANRDVLVVDVLPRNPGNPWKRYWIDQNTDVILGWAHYSADGAAESVSQFQQVEFTPQADSLFDPPPAQARVLNPVVYQPMSLAQLQARVGFRVDEPVWVPPGYAVQSYILTSCEDGCGAPVAMTRYSDGVNSISIFQCPLVKPVHTRADDHIVRAFRNNMNYVAVGDLGTADLKRMLDSIAVRISAASTYRPSTPPPH
jgi:negative regulator of sigma E activity